MKGLQTGMRAVLCLGGLFSLLSLAGCGEQKKQQTEQRPVPVAMATVEQRDIARTLTAVGTVTPAASVAVKPQVGGQIVSSPIRSGQDVLKGQTLFQIDPRPYESIVNEAAARLSRDRVLLKKAEEDKARFARLVSQDAVSREQYDQAVTNAQSQQAAVAEDEAALASAKLQLEYATIKAPVSGMVGQIFVDPGNVVKANDDRTLVTINTLAPAKITFAVPERYLGEILTQYRSAGLPVHALPEGQETEPVTGKVVSIDNTVDTTTGTIKLEALFENKDLRLWPGQFTRLSVDLAEVKNALLVPSSAVMEGSAGPYVYRVKPDNTVEVSLVVVQSAPDELRIVTSGLARGDKVVIDGQLSLAPGFRITDKTALSPIAPGNAAKDEKAPGQ